MPKLLPENSKSVERESGEKAFTQWVIAGKVEGVGLTYLIEIIGHEHSTRNHAHATRNAHLDVDFAEEDEEVCPELGRIPAFVISELGSIGPEVYGGVVGDRPLGWN